MRTFWMALLWRCLPAEMKSRLLYTTWLESNLFVELPVLTKRRFILQAQSVLGYSTFVETGAFKGAMTRYASGLFQTVHTIELDPLLAERAKRELSELPNVCVHQGDSGTILPELLATIGTPCLFWLDAHFCGGASARGETDTPVLAELKAIAGHRVRPHAILIDDARVFGTDEAYPTIEQVVGLLREIDPGFKIGISSDIIWAAPVRLLRFEWRTLPSGAVVPPTTAPAALGGDPAPPRGRVGTAALDPGLHQPNGMTPSMPVSAPGHIGENAGSESQTGRTDGFRPL